MIKLKIGTKGELIIPKKIREHLGFAKGRPVVLEVKDKSVELSAAPSDIVKTWQKRAEKQKAKISKWVMGDELYEEVF